MNLKKVTRVPVVDHSTPTQAPFETGRVFEKLGISVTLSLQDGGRTLKVFISDPPGNHATL